MKFNKVVILEKTGIEEFALEQLESITNELVVYSDSPKSNEEILKRAEGADCILISWTSRIDGDVINNLHGLKYIGMCCSLYDEKSANVDLLSARQNLVTVAGVREYGDQGVVQYIFSELIRLLLGTGRIKFLDEPIELEEMKMGIIGLGAVGKKVARTAEFFGMDVCYYGRKVQNDVEYTYLPLDALLEECDIISMHLPRNTIVLKKEEFNKLKGRKILINTGLGFSFDKEAFNQWIKSDGHYAIFDAASIDDNFLKEHLSDNNIVMTTVVSGFTRNARKRLAEKVMLNINNYLDGVST